MPCAGSADAGRRLLATIALAVLAAASPVAAQTQAAEQDYERGLKALAEHRFADARAALRQAVEADPSFAGAWLDLAIATEADGDPVEAEEFLDILEARFKLPPVIAAGVAQLRARLQNRAAIAADVWRWKTQLQMGAGRDSNANSGLSLPDLTLTLPGGSVVLPVGRAQLQQPDNYVLTSLAIEGLHKLGEDGDWQLSAASRARANQQLHAYDTVELQAGTAYIGSRPAWGGPWARIFPGPWRVGASAQRLVLGGSTLLDSFSVTGVHAWTGVTCGPQAGLEFGVRNFPLAPNLDSDITWLSGSALCDTRFLVERSTLTVQAKVGYEGARHGYESALGRPGDNTRHVDFTALERWTHPGRFGDERMEVQFQWSSAHDTRGYSPLLASNETRRLYRTSLGLAYTMPLPATPWAGGDWALTGAAQVFRQTSNLEIFRVNGRILQLTLQKTW